MKYNPDKHHRQSIRLQKYDYSRPGWYFVTICAYDRECLFGEIVDGKMILNEFGKIVCNEWLKTPKLRNNIVMDEFIVMPNHFHGIINIRDNRRGVLQYAPTKFKSPSQTIGAIIRGFKSISTKHINQLRNTPGLRLWQRNYYEHIIRGAKNLHAIRKYIRHNPRQWSMDQENPDQIKK